MTDSELTIDQVRRMAEEIGMTRLSDEHLQALLRATAASRARRGALPSATLGLAHEPAHLFSLGDCKLP